MSILRRAGRSVLLFLSLRKVSIHLYVGTLRSSTMQCKFSYRTDLCQRNGVWFWRLCSTYPVRRIHNFLHFAAIRNHLHRDPCRCWCRCRCRLPHYRFAFDHFSTWIISVAKRVSSRGSSNSRLYSVLGIAKAKASPHHCRYPMMKMSQY